MARFTEYGGDPAWLKAQRDAQVRATQTRTPRQQKAMPYPTATTVGNSSRKDFVVGAKQDSQLGAFITGAIIGAILGGRRGR